MQGVTGQAQARAGQGVVTVAAGQLLLQVMTCDAPAAGHKLAATCNPTACSPPSSHHCS